MIEPHATRIGWIEALAVVVVFYLGVMLGALWVLATLSPRDCL